jgi:hypothetical protein
VRLLGSNLTFGGAFPPKELAPHIAARMRKLGMNVVRFHHMDNQTAPRGIWLPEQKGLDPEQIDRLDWLIYQLKQHGIYANINLHVSRNYPGLPKELGQKFHYGKSIDNFYPPFIQMQKDYARMLLTHQNPYTKTTYAHEPGVIVVELNNENTLLNASWSELRQLPSPFKEELERQWRQWLREHYRSTDDLRRAWNAEAQPLGKEMLTNGDFSQGLQGWKQEQGSGAKMEAAVEAEGDTHCVHIRTLKPGEQSWNLQFHWTGLDLKNGQPYTLRFRARTEKAREVSISARFDIDPWRFIGLQETATLEPQWKEYQFTFRCKEPMPNHTRISFDFKNQLGDFWIANVSLRPGGILGIPPEESLEKENVSLPPSNATPAQQSDFWQFLIETEQRYVKEMVTYLKRDLDVQASIVDTQASYGGLAGVWREATLCDYIDMHAYWQHPHFPGKPWDSRNWFIPNTSMVASAEGGTLTGLASHRVEGRVFTVSEYDHPAPSDYSAELFPMLASFAAFQDWDGIYQFDYHSNADEWDQRRIRGYFELCSHPGKIVFMPAAAVMFRAGAVSPARESLTLTVPINRIADEIAQFGVSLKHQASETGLARTASVVHKFALRVIPTGEWKASRKLPEESPVREADTGEIVWDVGDPKRAVYLVNAPAARTAVGFIGGYNVALGDVTVMVEKGNGAWAAVTLVALDGKPIAESRRMLLSAAARVENTNMVWNEKRTSVSNQWGTEPTVAEAVVADIDLPGAAMIQPLDGAGRLTGAPRPGAKLGDRCRLHISGEDRTLWYAVTRP